MSKEASREEMLISAIRCIDKDAQFWKDAIFHEYFANEGRDSLLREFYGRRFDKVNLRPTQK